jgi:hypothetical protein
MRLESATDMLLGGVRLRVERTGVIVEPERLHILSPHLTTSSEL